MNNEEWCKKNCPYSTDCACDGVCNFVLSLLKEQDAVVRCKDCIYGDDFDCPAPLPTGYLCQKGHGSHMGDWYCADGEREEE